MQESIAALKNDSFKSIVDKAFDLSGLQNKGVEFVDANKNNIDELYAAMEKETPKWINKIPGAGKIINAMDKPVVQSIADGKNAISLPKVGKIFVNKGKISWLHFMKWVTP